MQSIYGPHPALRLDQQRFGRRLAWHCCIVKQFSDCVAASEKGGIHFHISGGANIKVNPFHAVFSVHNPYVFNVARIYTDTTFAEVVCDCG
jgi:hypothetical protein